ncbi:MAG: penicillin-binding protein, partial [Microbacteriaceae bacterium]|nr:penicillin-binding protein [Burkholderiaceae bacterium]
VVFEAPAPPARDEALRVVPARNVFITNSLLNDVARYGTAARAQGQLGRGDLYGKTGTTNDAVDAWFAGFQAGPAGGLVAVVWLGHDEPQSLGSRESGGGLALPVWIAYMAQALKGVAVAPPPEPPEGVSRLNDDWVYSQWADGSFVAGVGLDEAVQPAEAASAAGPALPSAAPLPARSAPPASSPAPAAATAPAPPAPPAPSPASGVHRP